MRRVPEMQLSLQVPWLATFYGRPVVIVVEDLTDTPGGFIERVGDALSREADFWDRQITDSELTAALRSAAIHPPLGSP